MRRSGLVGITAAVLAVVTSTSEAPRGFTSRPVEHVAQAGRVGGSGAAARSVRPRTSLGRAPVIPAGPPPGPGRPGGALQGWGGTGINSGTGVGLR